MEAPDPTPRRTARAVNRRTYRLAGLLLLAVTVAAGTVTLVLVERWESARTPSTTGAGAVAGGGAASPFTATMYYVAGNGVGLVRREIDVPYGTDTLARARIIVERQLDLPPRPLLSPFPRGTRLHAVYLAADGSLFVDLSGEVTTEHSGGSLDEALTVYALVNALATNLPEVAGVQILVDGREVDTLAGHIDLRQPLSPNLTWVTDLPRATDDAAPAATDDAAPAASDPRQEAGRRADESAAPAAEAGVR